MATNVPVGICPICMEYYKDPRILDCGHSICKSCIDEIFASRAWQGNLLGCPICRAQTHCHGKGTEGIKKNYQLKEMVEMISASWNQETNCEHHSEPFVRYCGACEELTCPECVIGKHSGHDFMTIDQKYETVVADLKATENIVVDDENKIKERLREKHAAMDNLETAQKKTEENAANSFALLQKQFDRKLAEMRTKNQNDADELKKPIRKEIQALQTSLKSLNESKNSFNESRRKGKLNIIIEYGVLEL